MTNKLITYEDYPDASGYSHQRQTRPMESAGSVVRSGGLQAVADRLASYGPEPEPKVCPYADCENTYDYDLEQQIWKARPTGYIALSNGRMRQCRCLLDRIEAAIKSNQSTKPSTPGKLFTREPTTDDPEGDL